MNIKSLRSRRILQLIPHLTLTPTTKHSVTPSVRFIYFVPVFDAGRVGAAEDPDGVVDRARGVRELYVYRLLRLVVDEFVRHRLPVTPVR